MSEALDHTTAYRSLRTRVTELASGLDDEASLAIVPATPDWRIKDLIAHFAGTTADLVAGKLEGAGSDDWTEAQVAPRRDASLADLLDEWNACADEFDSMIPDIPIFQRSQVLFDAETHEQDLRGALGVVGARDSDAFDIGWEWAAAIVGQMRDGHQAGALRLRTDAGDQVVGAGDVTATVSADRFELFRAMTGRRSVAQVKAYPWEGEPKVGHLCFLPCRPDDLVE